MGAIVVSVFALVIAIYSFIIVKKKVTREAQTEAVNCVAAAVTAATNGECRSANAADADVIIVGADITGSALAHTLDKVCQILYHFYFSSSFLGNQTVH